MTRERCPRILAFIALASALGLAPTRLPAQGLVTGRVTLAERPGETTTDYANTVVYLVPLDTAARGRLRPTKGAIAMNGRAFVPHVRVVTPGSRVEFPNQDPFSHNIFSVSAGAAFDLGLYAAGKSKEAEFKRAGAFPVYCNIHPRMTSFVVVVPTPYFTHAGNDGRWTMASVPAGRYKLHVWHERAPADVADLLVTAVGATATTALDARGFRFAEHKNKFGKAYDKTGKDRY